MKKYLTLLSLTILSMIHSVFAAPGVTQTCDKNNLCEAEYHSTWNVLFNSVVYGNEISFKHIESSSIGVSISDRTNSCAPIQSHITTGSICINANSSCEVKSAIPGIQHFSGTSVVLHCGDIRNVRVYYPLVKQDQWGAKCKIIGKTMRCVSGIG